MSVKYFLSKGIGILIIYFFYFKCKIVYVNVRFCKNKKKVIINLKNVSLLI